MNCSGRADFQAEGMGMLVEPAAEAFVWWRGVRPRTVQVMKALHVPFA